MDKSRFKKAQKRIIMDFEHNKAYLEWVKLPMWEKYEQDYIPGIDDGEPPAGYARQHPEEYDFGRNPENE